VTKKRLLILDIETTGFRVGEGHRMTELACAEMVDGILTGRQYHQYINPEREVDPGAQKLTGLTWSFLKQYPTFGQIVRDFLDFLGDDHLVIHNSSFDLSFINYQLAIERHPKIEKMRVIDTLHMARSKFPGKGNSLDALCERFGISLNTRGYHGALIDVQLLARVYIELTGGIQRKLKLVMNQSDEPGVLKPIPVQFPRRVFSSDYANGHGAFLEDNLAKHKWGN
jgi:DNA polymerase-3 subunit epsilon